MSIIHIHTSNKEKLQLFFWRPYAVLGTVFFAIGTIWLIGFCPQCDFTSLRFIKTKKRIAQGTVEHISQTALKEKYLHILTYTISYEQGGKRYKSKSYGTDYTLEAGDTVPVEYLLSDPNIARIQGMRNAPFGLWLFFLLAPFSIIGLFGLVISISKTIQIINTLKDGSIVSGKLIKRQIPFLTKKHQKTIRLEYAYSKLGQLYRNITLTISPESFKEEEKVLISNKRHSASVLLNALPQSIRWKVRELRAKQLAPCLN